MFDIYELMNKFQLYSVFKHIRSVSFVCIIVYLNLLLFPAMLLFMPLFKVTCVKIGRVVFLAHLSQHKMCL